MDKSFLWLYNLSYTFDIYHLCLSCNALMHRSVRHYQRIRIYYSIRDDLVRIYYRLYNDLLLNYISLVHKN